MGGVARRVLERWHRAAAPCGGACGEDTDGRKERGREGGRGGDGGGGMTVELKPFPGPSTVGGIDLEDGGWDLV